MSSIIVHSNSSQVLTQMSFPSGQPAMLRIALQAGNEMERGNLII